MELKNLSGMPPIKACYVAKRTSNPLVNALPPIKTDKEWIEQLLCVPLFDASQRDDEAYIRGYHVSQLKNVFIVTKRHAELARRMDQLIRWGYEKRNPLDNGRAILLQQSYEKTQRGAGSPKQVFDEGDAISSSSLIGMSGMGKSTTMRAILGAYPQYILHTELNLHQVTWLKVDCPRDGSVKELAISILRAFDRVLGTQHAPQGKTDRTSVGYLTGTVAQLATTYALGVLVIDETQNLTVKQSGGRQEMLNWFQELVNELRLPVFVMGTFGARSILGLDVRHARRHTIVGSAEWDPMGNDKEFELLVKNIWTYQWLRDPLPLTPEMIKAIFVETQGVSAFVVDMFLVAQLRALRTGKEQITAELFQKVARTEFKPVQPILSALRSKQPNRLRKFEDAVSYDIQALIDTEVHLIPQPASPASGSAQATSMTTQAALNLMSAFGLPKEDAMRLVMAVLTSAHKSARKLTEDACSLYLKKLSDDGAEPLSPVGA